MRSADRGSRAHDLEESFRDLIFCKECVSSEADFAFLRLYEIICHLVDSKILKQFCILRRELYLRYRSVT